MSASRDRPELPARPAPRLERAGLAARGWEQERVEQVGMSLRVALPLAAALQLVAAVSLARPKCRRRARVRLRP